MYNPCQWQDQHNRHNLPLGDNQAAEEDNHNNLLLEDNQAVEEVEEAEEVAEANQQPDNKLQDKPPQPHLIQNP
jgi:hypothetical protein